MADRRRQTLVRECVMALGFAVALSAASELFFTMLGVVDKDGANLLGHIYKLAANLYLFHASFNEALRRPLERLEVQSLRESVTLKAAPDGVLWVDNAGRILTANPAMETLSGYTTTELVGRSVDIFLLEHRRARHAESIRGYFTAPQSRAMGLMDLKLLRRDGQMLPVDISLGHWDGEGSDQAIAVIRDLTERKKFEEAGRGTYACYAQEMDLRAHEDMRLHTRLKEALAQGVLQLHYQPQMDVASGAIVGAEALLRWHDSELGNVSPLRVAVNFSAQQFRQRNLPEQVRAALARTGAQAQWLDIEITESVAMTQPEQAREQLDALVGLGCGVAMDDFGTGYSSLAYLKVLPVSQLKIDKSFMDGIPDDANDATISRAIIALAHSLGMTLFAKAMDANELTKLLRA